MFDVIVGDGVAELVTAQGFGVVFFENGVQPGPQLLVSFTDNGGGYIYENYDVGKTVLSKVYDECSPFTAIMAASDTYAIGCYRFLKSKGVKCPEDVSIIGADNLDCVENQFTRSLPIGLTTVWCEPSDVAQKVYEQIEFRLKEEVFNKTPAEVIEVTPKLVLRESTACPTLTFGGPKQ